MFQIGEDEDEADEKLQGVLPFQVEPLERGRLAGEGKQFNGRKFGFI